MSATNELDEFGIEVKGNKLPAKIEMIRLGTPAALSGLNVGDDIQSFSYKYSTLTVTIKRNGKLFQAKLHKETAQDLSVDHESIWTPGDPLDKQPEARAALRNGPSHSLTRLNKAEKEALKNSDVYLLLDNSGSMNINDCPTGKGSAQSRISWVKQELLGFAGDLEGSLPHGFTFIVFNSNPKGYSIRTASECSNALRAVDISGDSILAPALKQVFNHHQRYRNQPLRIAVITDCEIDVDDVMQTIATATHEFPRPNGIFITFAEIGLMANNKISENVNAISKYNPAYNPCLLVPFKSLRQNGLGRSILLALERKGTH